MNEDRMTFFDWIQSNPDGIGGDIYEFFLTSPFAPHNEREFTTLLNFVKGTGVSLEKDLKKAFREYQTVN